MKRKIFISINLSDKTKKRLAQFAEKWADLPVKWVKEPNLHITLSFLGYVSDDAIGEICEKARKAVETEEIFDVEFDHIEIGPSEKDPGLIWLTGEPSAELKHLQESIEKELGIFVCGKKSFRPHITLGRIRKLRWEALPEKPRIFEKFPLVVPAESVAVMASDFAGGGPEYTIIESCPLK